MLIIGAGLSGLLAANLLRKHKPTIIEKQDSLPHNHAALLRHRESTIGEAVGIPFKKVLVQKAISYNNKLHTTTNLFFQNLYSKKVTDKYLSRSISNLDPVERFIAPSDFIEKLAYGCDIKFGTEFEFPNITLSNPNTPIITTMPMPITVNQLLPQFTNISFNKKRIITLNADLKTPTDLYQTIYYPDPKLSIYRISITSNKLICEFLSSPSDRVLCQESDRRFLINFITQLLEQDFGIISEIENISIKENNYGKIEPIDNETRKKIIFELTQKYGIYSIGRFAIWKNVLLDDVYKDIKIVEQLIQNGNYFVGVKS